MSILGCVTSPLRSARYLINSVNEASDDLFSSKKDLSSLPNLSLDGHVPLHHTTLTRQVLTHRLLHAKELSGQSFSGIASHCGITNVYCAQLFYTQAQLKPQTARRLLQVLPHLTRDDIMAMSKPPMRLYDPDLKKQSPVSTLCEATMHNGNALKGRY